MNVVQLNALTHHAKLLGVEGTWLVRGGGAARLTLTYLHQGKEQEIDLNFAESELVIVMRFPQGDGKESGVEFR